MLTAQDAGIWCAGRVGDSGLHLFQLAPQESGADNWSINWGHGDPEAFSRPSGALGHSFPSSSVAEYAITGSARDGTTEVGRYGYLSQSPIGSSSAVVQDVLVQDDGLLVVLAGQELTRYLRNGLIDPDFGDGGHVTTGIAAGRLVQAGSLIVVGGDDFVLEAYAISDGQPAWSLDIEVVDESSDLLRALTLDGQGRIIAAGDTYYESLPETRVALARVLPATGVLDEDFGGDQSGIIIDDSSDSYTIGYDVAVQQATVGGQQREMIYIIDPSSGDILRYDPSDNRDMSFGAQGAAATGLTSPMMIEPHEGGLAVAGGLISGSFAIRRFQADGTQDAGFGDDGTAEMTDEGAVIQDLGVDGEGHIIASGGYSGSGGSGGLLVRLEADGDFDYFAENGRRLGAAASFGSLVALAVDSSGAILGADDEGAWLFRPFLPVDLAAAEVEATPIAADGTIQLTWGAVAGVGGYRVNHYSDPAGEPDRWATVSSATTSWSDTEAAPGGTNYYTLSALFGSGEVGAESAMVAAQALQPALSAPTNVHFDGSGVLCWDAVTGATSYTIYRYHEPLLYPIPAPYVSGVTGTSFADPQPMDQAKYRVAAVAGDTDSGLAYGQVAVWNHADPYALHLDVYDCSLGSISLRMVGHSYGQQYTMARDPEWGSGPAKQSTSDPFEDTELTPGAWYTYTAEVTDPWGQVQASQPLRVFYGDKPAAPALAEWTGEGVILHWTMCEGADYYSIYEDGQCIVSEFHGTEWREDYWGGPYAITASNEFGESSPTECGTRQPWGEVNSGSIESISLWMDLDTDSDNDGELVPRDWGQTWFDAWLEHNRTRMEGLHEDDDNVRVLATNWDDDDQDGVPDFAGGFNAYDDDLVPLAVASRASFAPPVDVDDLRFRLLYSASIDVTASGGVYTPESGDVRIWAAPDGETPFAVEPDTPYTWSELGLEIVSGQVKGLLYLEGIRPAQCDITLQVSIDGYTGSVDDTVRVLVDDVNIGVDTDNDGDSQAVEEFTADDQFEAAAGADRPGRLVRLNTDDTDGDGIPDIYDGFDADRQAGTADDETFGETMDTISIQLSSGINLSTARIRISYPAADPDHIRPQRSWDDLEPYQDWIGCDPGAIRLWQTGGGPGSRDAQPFATAAAPGNYYVPPGEYWGADLTKLGLDDGSTTMYVEGVSAGSDLGETLLTIEVDPDGPGPLGYMVQDAVRLTVLDGLLSADTNVVIVDDSDHDYDGEPGFAETVEEEERLLPVTFQVPTGSYDVLGVSFTYDDSDPAADGGYAGQTCVAAPGHLRLYDSGFTFLPSDSTIIQVGDLNPVNGVVTLYLQGVRSSADPLDVQARFYDLSGTSAMPAGGIATAPLTVSVVQDLAAEMSGVVRLVDGQVVYSVTDIFSAGYGGGWSQGRTYSTDPLLRDGSRLGSGWDDLPRLIQSGGMVAIVAGGSAMYFDQVGADYVARFGIPQRLTLEVDEEFGWERFVLSDPDGSQWRFGAAEHPHSGFFLEFQDPAGNLAMVGDWTPNGQPVWIYRDQERCYYEYYLEGELEGLLKAVSIVRPEGAKTRIVQKVAYDYYLTGESNGQSRKLKTAKVSDGDGTLWGTSYYRYDTAGRLKGVWEADAYQRADNDLDPLQATDGELKPYSDYWLEYDTEGRVSSQSIRGLRDSNNGTFTYDYYSSAADAVGANFWNHSTVETSVLGYSRNVHANFAGQPVAAVLNANGSSSVQSFEYDQAGRLYRRADSAAVASFDPQPTSEGQYVTLHTDKGLIRQTTYTAQGLLEEVSLLHGTADNAPDSVSSLDYNSYASGGVTAWYTSASTVYADYDGGGGVTITMTPSDWIGFQPGKWLTDLPVVNGCSEAQLQETFNGYGWRVSSAVVAGSQTWSSTTYGWDAATGANTLVQSACGLQVEQQVDKLGRVWHIDNPGGADVSISHALADAGSATHSFVATGPGQKTTVDFGAGQTESVLFRSGDAPVAPVKTFTDIQGRTYEDRVYWDASHYYVTEYEYADNGLLDYAKESAGTYIQYGYDGLGRVVSEFKGTGLESLVLLRQYEYDNGALGDGSVTKITDYTDTGGLVTRMEYDWRNRLVRQMGPDLVVQQYTYDNLGRVILTQTYAGGAWNATTKAIEVTASNLRAQSGATYNARGLVEAEAAWAVSPTTGAVGNKLETRYWYDEAGRLVKVKDPSGLFRKTAYDAADRVTDSYVSYDTSELDSEYSKAVNVDADVVIEQVHYAHDSAAGNLISTTTYQRVQGNTTKLGALSASWSAADSRRGFTGFWYDGAERLMAEADFGTTTATRPDDPPVGSDSCIVAWYVYDTAGRREYVYDNAMRRQKTEYNAAGQVVKVIENDTGRALTPSTPAEQDRTTAYAYTSGGLLDSLKAYNPDGQTLCEQTTVYLHGDSVDASLVTTETYPDGKQVDYLYDRSGRTTYKIDELGAHTFVYDAAGRLQAETASVSTVTDAWVARAVVYAYDDISRLAKITSHSQEAYTDSNVLNEVGLVYDDYGNVKQDRQNHTARTTAYTVRVAYTYEDGASGGVAQYNRLACVTYPNGSEVYYCYDDASPVGKTRVWAIGPSESVSYAQYDYLGLNTIVKVAHPGVAGGLNLDYTGSAPGTYDGLDAFGRIISQKWDKDNNAAVDRFTYGYDANSNRLFRKNELNHTLDELYHADGAADVDAYDALGRLKEFQRGEITLDANGRQQVTTASRSASWGLDALGNWLTNTTDAQNQTRTYTDANELSTINGQSTHVGHDAAGNMNRMPCPGDVTGDHWLGVYDAWDHLVAVYDDTNNDGDLDITSAPYDKLIAQYRYDGLGRRIAKTIVQSYYIDGQPKTYGRFDYYYNEDWQVVEERFEPEQTTPDAKATRSWVQYVWDLSYVDTPILRLRDADGIGGGLEEMTYYVTDANHNVTALVKSNGTVMERYLYDAYGQSTAYDTVHRELWWRDNFDDCSDWQVGDDATVSNVTDSGRAAMKLSVPAYYSDGAWCASQPVLNLSASSGVSVWIKTNIALPANSVQVQLWDGGGSGVIAYLPAITQTGTWQQVYIPKQTMCRLDECDRTAVGASGVPGNLELLLDDLMAYIDPGNEVRYAGLALDFETGLYLARNRYLHPTLGQWTGPDPGGYVDGPQLYAYCGSEPLGRTDPSGMDYLVWGKRGPERVCSPYKSRADAEAAAAGANVPRFGAPCTDPWAPKEVLARIWVELHMAWATSAPFLGLGGAGSVGARARAVAPGVVDAGAADLLASELQALARAAQSGFRGSMELPAAVFRQGLPALAQGARALFRASMESPGVVFQEGLSGLAQGARALFRASMESPGVVFRQGLQALGKAAAEATTTAMAGVRSAASRIVPNLGKKLEYLFGRAAGSAHNVQRSESMLAQLERIGLSDSAASRGVVRQHLEGVVSDVSNVVRTQANGWAVRESLLMGPLGGTKIQSVWQGIKLVTVRLFGGGS